ncbi:oxidoreductase C-terminal domain-containing protein, partial [Stenotrophomonas maltophilia]|uniref:oxidoreductase C-terminal domain-containing protein n=1 Tax=Stenotrophomonas maltophilia TaxID=40324 RepID=UPI0019531FB7
SQTGKRAAESLAAHLNGQELTGSRFDPLPSFWSDQFDMRIQGFGAPALADRREVVAGSISADGHLGSGFAVACYRGSRLVAMVG